jgi:hypothetical protein
MPHHDSAHVRRTVTLTALALLLAAPAMAQIMFPRIGISAAPDRYVSTVEVYGDETFELYIVALPAEDQVVHQHDYGTFQWAVLEACCGGAAEIIAEDYNPEFEHQGSAYGGVVTTSEECMNGQAVLLCTLTLQMDTDDPGVYYVMAGPLALSQTCAGDDVVMTDMIAFVNYEAGATPVERTSLTAVKDLFE